MKALRISTRLAAASTVSVLSLLVCGAMGYLGLRQQRAAADTFLDQLAEDQITSRLRADVAETHTGVYRYITWMVADYGQAKVDALGKAQLERLDAVRTRVAGRLAGVDLRDDERALYGALAEQLEKYQRKLVTVMDLSTGDIATSTMYMANADAAFQELAATLAALSSLEQKLSAAQDAASREGFRRIVGLLLAVVIAAGATLAAVSVLLSRSIGGGIRSLLRQASRLTDAVERGELATRGDAAEVGIDFRPVVEGMNTTMDAFARPMGLASATVARIARGDLPEAITEEYRGDFETLKRNLNQCVDAVRALIADANMLSRAAVEGRLSSRADPAKHQGAFGEVIRGVNDTLDAVVGPLSVAAQCVDRIAQGRIPPRIAETYRGDFDALKVNLNRCIDAVNALVHDASALAQAGMDGALSTRVDPARHQGDFRTVVEGMNATLDGLVGPIRLAAGVLDRISRGEIPEEITEAYPGDFDAIKGSLNRCIEAVHALIEDTDALSEAAVAGRLTSRADAARHAGDFRRIVEGVNTTLDAFLAPVEEAVRTMEQLAGRDLRARMTGQYQGDHARLKEAVNGTGTSLHDAVAQVARASDQVSSAATQIASSSQSVASGASEQASSIEQTSASLESMAAMTRASAAHAAQADSLSRAAQTAAGDGSAAMEEMQGAMQRIRGAAEATAQIIGDINEIAFQTNLLALNAAVEAARAGEAGRGFAVVAEEVRSLALRSKEAARKTEELIHQSVKEAEGGAATSRHVHERLGQIVGAVAKVTEIVGEISRTTGAQSEGIAQVSAAVSEMDKVTQQNAASAEESSSSAEELSSQSEELAAMVGTFKLDGGAEPAPRLALPGARPRRPRRPPDERERDAQARAF